MINKTTINNLKMFKVTDDNIIPISKLFPILFGNILKLAYVQVKPDMIVALNYDYMLFIQFQTKLGYAILTHSYDTLDNIILEFLDSYNYGIPPEHMFYIDFSKDERQNFIDTCNSFKGKYWNDILDDFIEGFYNLLCTAHLDSMDGQHKLTLNLN
jgi:hypothetical protein